MHRPIAPDTTPTKPAAPSGTQGYFQNGPPGTVVPAEFLNSLADEIIFTIALKGGSPNPSNDMQLQEVLAPSVLAVEGGGVLAGPVAATNGYTRAVIACDTG